MSSRLHLLSSLPDPGVFETPSHKPPAFHPLPNWDAGNFAQEQLRRLVRQVFFPGWPRPSRHVAFVAVDEDIDANAICLQVGHLLSSEIQANTCVLEASRSSLVDQPSREMSGVGAADLGDSIRKRARRISSRLWVLPQQTFLEGCGAGLSAAWLEGRLQKLRADFDFTLLHLPDADRCSEALLLGHLSDGVVLVLEANSTRRAKALRVKEMFQAANVRILGTVLNGRQFPIPEGIYRRL
jgi:hypothetical protein